MKEKTKRKITRQQYLQALGLFQLGFKYAEQAVECEKELNELLALDDYSHLSDAVWGSRDFHEALKLEGLEYPKDKKRKSA